MNKTYLIFKHEFMGTVKKPGFIFMTLLVPVAALIAIGVFYLFSLNTGEDEPVNYSIGYIDQVGIFDYLLEDIDLQMIPFASEAEARKAVSEKAIKEYFIIPEDYQTTGKISYYTSKGSVVLSNNLTGTIKAFLSVNMLKGEIPGEKIRIIVTPLKLDLVHIKDDGVSKPGEFNFGNIIIPGVFSLLLAMTFSFCSHNLITSFGEEKESRLIEVLFSSVSIKQLLLAKIMALGLAGLLQVLVWLLSAPLLLNLATASFGGFLEGIRIPANFIVLGVIFFLLGYLLFAVLSVGVGGISNNAREGSQLSLFYILTGFSPLWFSALTFQFPDLPIWTVMTIFPITAPVEVMLRLGVSGVPLWELIASIAALILSIIPGAILIDQDLQNSYADAWKKAKPEGYN
jgi:ABC-2 type transport system permease protein